MWWDKRPLWDEKVKLQMFTKERDEACQSFDVATFKKFYRRWVELGYYDPLDIADDVIEITMRKMVCNMKNPDKDKLEEAKKWLKERRISTRL